MKGDHVRRLVDRALDQLAEALAGGRSEALLAYLSAMARFSTYSVGNLLLLLAQRPEASRVAGYGTWKKLGRQVKRGEHGIVILAPMVCRECKTDERSRSPPSEESEGILLGFKPVYVFDVSQTEGRPLPEPARPSGDPAGHTERLKAFISSSGITLEYSSALGTADGLSCGGRITLRKGLPPAEELSVLVHELSHELLHRDEPGRKLSQTVKESEAEAVAFVVAQAIGLEATTASSDYIKSYFGDKKTLADSLERIRKTAARILEAIAADDKRGEATSPSTDLAGETCTRRSPDP